MNYIPLAVGSAVGLGDGLVGLLSLGGFAYKHTVYRLLAFGLGLTGEFMEWNPELTYGLMTASATLVASRIPAVAFQGGGIKAFGELSGSSAGGGWGTQSVDDVIPLDPGAANKIWLPGPGGGSGLHALPSPLG